MKKFYRVICTVDQNDADYNTQVSKLPEEDIPMLRDLASRIVKFKPYKAMSKYGSEFNHSHNYPYINCVREDLGEKTPKELYNLTNEEENFLNEILPCCGDYGFHSIISIEILPYEEAEKLL
jgi:hypothetical protein